MHLAWLAKVERPGILRGRFATQNECTAHRRQYSEKGSQMSRLTGTNQGCRLPGPEGRFQMSSQSRDQEEKPAATQTPAAKSEEEIPKKD